MTYAMNIYLIIVQSFENLINPLGLKILPFETNEVNGGV